MSCIDELLRSATVGPGGGSLATAGFPVGERMSELQALLERRDGFYAFESALHVFPSSPTPTQWGLVAWNGPKTWRQEFSGLDPAIVFFAEDLFGLQFGFHEGRVIRFDPETGELEPLCDTLEEWAGRLLAEHEILAGSPLAHRWQAAHGALPEGKRLVPKIPFVLGGAFDVSNLAAMDDVEGMRFRADIARQIRDLPDGAQVQLKVVE